MELRERSLTRPDGRTVAWTEYGDPAGQPLLRVPGTPGSRYPVLADPTPWDDRDLWVISTERPGFGASTRLPGRGFSEHADDLVAILDEIGVEQVPVLGGSGAAPHILCLCARHPARVAAATIEVGLAPPREEEVEEMIELNRRVFTAARLGDRATVAELTSASHDAMSGDPLAGFRSVMDSAPPDDQAVMRDAGWQEAFARNVTEALAQGPEGWVDEAMALGGDWSDVDVAQVHTSLTWFHAAGDRNAPLAAAHRLVGQLPSATLVEWPAEVGHLYGHRHEGEVLDELLARCGT
ncbi:alpha/beta hydrolase [Nocardioides panacisoli]|uniref:alpha/beta hydrolase n=1 Tax=Nocardioides panacisoli TaxID=627624 RepID=UPI001C6286BD|nr:alpha/beta hydrolase [Nocardioides panacisoli]QYJ03680.1 alpha/beta hydrolase [Nocardioides panacisoli]